MSLAIDVDLVTDVLLADGWHKVASKSFNLDSYEYLWSGRTGMTVAQFEEHYKDDAMLIHPGGNSGVCATGFGFETDQGEWMYGPLTAVLAVKTRRPA